MLQKVIRKTLTGSFDFFDFEIPIRSFVVKNFSKNPIYCSFEDGTEENKCVRIEPKFAEVLYYNESYPHRFNGIYVKGTGDVEVEANDW